MLYKDREYKSILIEIFGETPKMKIIDFLLDNPYFDFTKKEIIESLGMSKQTFYKYFPDLEKYGIVKVSRKIGRAKLYKINLNHPLIKILRELEKTISLQMAEKEKIKMKKELEVKN